MHRDRLKMKIYLILFSVIGFASATLFPVSDAKTIESRQEKAGIAATQNSTSEYSDPSTLAEQIIGGLISEKQFKQLRLTDQQVFDVFKEISEKRGWGADDELLTQIARTRGRVAPETTEISLADDPCKQTTIEMQQGSSNFIYPYGQFRPRPGEICGSQPSDRVLPDRVLEYRPRRAPSNPDNVKWWSNTWYVRWVLAVTYHGRLGAEGACSKKIRVCIGIKALALLGPQDLRKIYLWWNN